MRVLFLCNRNACRSQLAAAILLKMHPSWTVCSAGARTFRDIHWKTRAIAWELGLELDYPKHWTMYSNQSFDRIIAFSQYARDSIGNSVFDIEVVSIDDPMPDGSREDFLKTRDAISDWIVKTFVESGEAG